MFHLSCDCTFIAAVVKGHQWQGLVELFLVNNFGRGIGNCLVIFGFDIGVFLKARMALRTIS